MPTSEPTSAPTPAPTAMPIPAPTPTPTTAVPTPVPSITCTGSTYIYRLELSDSGGDGWQGAEWCVLDADEYAGLGWGQCLDTDGDAEDSWGDNCASWYTMSSRCTTSYDDDDFTAYDMCCTCGGGATTDTGKCTVAEAGGSSQADGTLANGGFGVEWMCLEDGCYELLVGGGTADSEIGFEFIDEGDGHFTDLSAPYADHFCVAGGLVFDHPTASPSVSAVPSAPPTPKPTTHCVDTDGDAADGWGDDCADSSFNYNDYPSYCGDSSLDDDDFTSSDMCCACGGGDHHDLAPSPGPTPSSPSPTVSAAPTYEEY